MDRLKIAKDWIAKRFLGSSTVPKSLSDLNHYFAVYKTINFSYKKLEDGSLLAMSSDFVYGSIVTSGKNEDDLGSNIPDAILTAFEVPSAYAKEANIHRVAAGEFSYALA